MRFISKTILLADDQKAIREQLREILRRTDYGVAGEVSNTDDLLVKAEALRPDCVIVDVTLRGTLDALVAIRRLRERYDRMVILITGSASQNRVVMEALSLGATDFVLRPLRERAVHAALHRHLG